MEGARQADCSSSRAWYILSAQKVVWKVAICICRQGWKTFSSVFVVFLPSWPGSPKMTATGPLLVVIVLSIRSTMWNKANFYIDTESTFWFFGKIFAVKLFLDCRFVESFWWFWWKINLLSMQFLCRWIGVERLNVSGFNNSWTNVWVVDISNMSNDLHLVHMVYHLARFIPAVMINLAASCLKGLRVNVMMPWVAAFNSTPISCKNNKTSCNSPLSCPTTPTCWRGYTTLFFVSNRLLIIRRQTTVANASFTIGNL